MQKRISRLIYIFSITFIFLSCNIKGGASPAPDNAPKFGKVKLDYTDTTDPAYKLMVYKLDTFYQAQVRAGFNGSVLIGYKGKILFERYYGVSQKESGALWTPETQSQLASTSKTLTSGAILLLKDKGLLNLDDYVSNYLTNFPYKDITIRMLLNHRSGLPDYIHLMSKPKDKDFLNNDDVVNFFVTQKPKLNFIPNTHFTYCNTNFALLASIVESVTGMKYDYFMKRFVFGPLDMTKTFVIDPTKERLCTAAFCYNYKWSKEPDMYLDGVWGDKGTYSSVRDMYKWDQALYNGKLIKKSTLNEAFKPYSFEKPGIKNYGLGWRMLNYPNGMKIIFHNGWWHGNNTCFYRFIDDNFTVIVLGNRFNKGIYHQPLKIYNILMGSNTLDEEASGEE